MPASRRLLCLLAVPAVTLVACGGNSDKDKISAIIKDGNNNPSSVCDHLDATLLKAIGGKAGCKKAAAGQPKDKTTTISDLKVDGDKASATVKDKSGSTTVKFVKDSGTWKVTAGK